MPGLPQKQENQVAIPAEAPMPQPRQPQNLQGLLRFAMEAQNNAAAQHEARPLDDESKKFLDEALRSMTVDVIALMKSQIEILKDVENIPESEVDGKITAFENILEHVSNIDLANDFHKINGFMIFDPCLKSEHSEIRVYACDLIAELAQNNPYIQNVICNCTNLMPTLLKILETDNAVSVQIKALYAISCITRDSELGFKNFMQHNGLEVLKKVFPTENEKIRTKIAFLLTALTRLDQNLIKNLIIMDFLPLLIKLIEGNWNSSHEHILSLLAMIIENEECARNELKKDPYGFKRVIKGHSEKIAGREEYKEEQIYCDKILQLVFN